MLALRTILHPNDCTQHSQNALDVATALAKQTGARLILLYVKPDQETVIGEFGTPPPEEDLSAEEYMENLRGIVPTDSQVTTECIVIEGSPVSEILGIAQKKSCDMIVMGGHHHSWLGRMFADIAEKVAGKARCPVVTIRDPK